MKKFFALSFVLIFGLIMAGGPIYGATIYVYPGGKIQFAIDAAIDGDHIIVQDGVYDGDGNYDLNYKGKAIHIRSANGPENCIINCKGKGRAVLFENDEGPDSIFEGFTVINGKVTTWGGGVYAPYASPIIRNVHCYNCHADNAGGGFATNFGAPQFIDCSAENCKARDGGGIMIYNSDPIYVENCQFIDNQAYDRGGGMYITGSDVKNSIKNCDIKRNTAIFGGGVYIINAHNLVFEKCEVKENRAVQRGGGFVLENNATVTMRMVDVSYNIAGDGGGGFALWMGRCDPAPPRLWFEGGDIWNNQASKGGGIAAIDAIIIVKGADIIGNAKYAIYIFEESTTPLPLIINSYLSDNEPEDFNY